MKPKNKIIIYRFTGRQGFFTVPKKWCEECDLLLLLVKNITKSDEFKDNTRLIVRPWFLWFWHPLLRYGSFHAPMLIINKKLISAGIVPTHEKVISALKENS